jgi:pyruvate/2-oxoglutarate dehydrogenase complex dihydrolipoamide dehydrogenase (E3) component
MSVARTICLCARLLFCPALIANKAKEISRLNSVYVNLLRNAGVAYYEGKGSLLDKNTVQVRHMRIVQCNEAGSVCGGACRPK